MEWLEALERDYGQRAKRGRVSQVWRDVAKLIAAVRLAERTLAETTPAVTSALEAVEMPASGARNFLLCGGGLAAGEQEKVLARLRSGDLEKPSAEGEKP